MAYQQTGPVPECAETKGFSPRVDLLLNSGTKLPCAQPLTIRNWTLWPRDPRAGASCLPCWFC